MSTNELKLEMMQHAFHADLCFRRLLAAQDMARERFLYVYPVVVRRSDVALAVETMLNMGKPQLVREHRLEVPVSAGYKQVSAHFL
jgi:hypothetical protein